MGIDTIYGGMYEQEISSVSSLNATDKTPNYWNVTDFAFGVLRLEYKLCIGFFFGAGILSRVEFGQESKLFKKNGMNVVLPQDQLQSNNSFIRRMKQWVLVKLP